MAEIIIRELDETTPGTAANQTNIVYVPGLAGMIAPSLSNNVVVIKKDTATSNKTESFTAAASQTEFNLTSPADAIAILNDSPDTLIVVKKNTVVLTQGTDYTVDNDNTLIILDTPASENDEIEITYYYSYYSTITIVSDVDSAKLNAAWGVKALPVTAVVDTAVTYSDSTYTAGDFSTADLSAWGIFTDIKADFFVRQYGSEAGLIYNYTLREPVLCSTTAQFQALVGAQPYRFTEDQDDPILAGKTMYLAGDYEKSYIYAQEVLATGLPVLYDPIQPVIGTAVLDNFSVSDIYAALAGNSTVDSIFKKLVDKGEYTIKYITSGAYPVFEYSSNAIANEMLTVAAVRGDAFVLIDHSNDPTRVLAGTGSVYAAVQDWAIQPTFTVGTEVTYQDLSTFGTMITPWSIYYCGTVAKINNGILQNTNSAVQTLAGGQLTMPGSFGYLLCLGNSIRYNPSWAAIAGVTRGLVPNLIAPNTYKALTNTIADSYQPRTKDRSINAITRINGYGYTLWGNRTLKNNSADGELTALSFLNIRNLMCDVKKRAFNTAQELMFEPDTLVLWLNFCSRMSTLLDQMQTNSGISGYRITKGTTDQKAKLVAVITLYPVYAVESFDITVVLSDEEVTVA